MRGVFWVGLVTCAVFGLLAPRVSAQHMWSDGNAATVEFSRPTRLGSTLLTAGRYQFQHHWIEGRHYLVVQSYGTPTHAKGSHEADTAGEVARVACRIVRTTLRGGTELWLTEGVDGMSTLTRIGLPDERRAHVLVPQPSS